ncbi:MAG: glycosyltransferase family 39 protein [Thermoanaerobaculia bacterium]
MINPYMRRPVVIAALLGAIILAGGFAHLDDYGVTWDEALGDLFFGQRYFAFFTTLDPEFLDFAANPPGLTPDTSMSPFRSYPWEYYPVANTLAAATSQLFSHCFGLVDPFDGFHALNLVLAFVFVLAFYPFAATRFGTVAALTATSLLFLSPRIAFDMMANTKDFPEMVFFSLALIAWFVALEKGSAVGIVGAGILAGLALGTKANALFLPLIPLAHLGLGGIPKSWSGRRRTLVFAIAGAAVAGLAVFYFSWPLLWSDPLAMLRLHLRYITKRKAITGAAHLASPYGMLLYTTTLPYLAAAIAGLVILMRRAFSPAAESVATRSLARFVLVWIAVVAARLAIPGTANFDGVRHFLEIFPPLAIAGGVAVASLARAAGARIPRFRRAFEVVLVATIAGLCAVSVVQSHPWQLAYWNPLAGGLSGARARGFPQAGDYWASSYRQGLTWINAHAEQGAALAVPIAEHTVRIAAPVRLRRDIDLLHIAPAGHPGLEPNAAHILGTAALLRPVYVMFILRDDWENPLTMELRRTAKPVASWKLDGVDLLQIYRLNAP